MKKKQAQLGRQKIHSLSRTLALTWALVSRLY